MLYFSKLRITLVSLVSIFFIFIAASNFQNSEDSFISKKINLGLDLQGGSYLLLEIDNGPVEIQKLQNTTTVIRNFLKDKKITFNDLRIESKKIIEGDFFFVTSPLFFCWLNVITLGRVTSEAKSIDDALPKSCGGRTSTCWDNRK